MRAGEGGDVAVEFHKCGEAVGLVQEIIFDEINDCIISAATRELFVQRCALAFFLRGQDGNREIGGFKERIQACERRGIGVIIKDAHFNFYIFNIFSRADQGIDTAQAMFGEVDACQARARVDVAFVAHAGAQVNDEVVEIAFRGPRRRIIEGAAGDTDMRVAFKIGHAQEIQATARAHVVAERL